MQMKHSGVHTLHVHVSKCYAISNAVKTGFQVAQHQLHVLLCTRIIRVLHLCKVSVCL